MYVHAKIGIVDDQWLTVGSANLNEHSLFNDSEMNVVTCDAALARRDPTAPVGRAHRAAGRGVDGRSLHGSSTRYGVRSAEEQARREPGGYAADAPADAAGQRVAGASTGCKARCEGFRWTGRSRSPRLTGQPRPGLT
ncbi:MAG: phospholipase D-like domain-containing protein [Nocardioidaceae bacterium]